MKTTYKVDYSLCGLLVIAIIGLFVEVAIEGQPRSKHTRQDTTSTEPATSSEIADLQARIKAIETVITCKPTGFSRGYLTSNSNDYLLVEVVTTNLVSVPCKCGYCRPEEGIRVPEHINQLGYDLELRIETNYLHVIHMSDRAYLYNPAKSANEVAQSHLSSLTNGIYYSEEAWTNATPERPERPDLRQTNSHVLTPHD